MKGIKMSFFPFFIKKMHFTKRASHVSYKCGRTVLPVL